MQKGYYERKEVTPEMINADEGVIDINQIKFNYPTKPDVQVLNGIDIKV